MALLVLPRVGSVDQVVISKPINGMLVFLSQLIREFLQPYMSVLSTRVN